MAANELGGKLSARLHAICGQLSLALCVLALSAGHNFGALSTVVLMKNEAIMSMHPSLSPKANVTYGVMEEECRALMQRFFQERR